MITFATSDNEATTKILRDKTVGLSCPVTQEIPGCCYLEILCVNTWLCSAVTGIDRPPAAAPSFHTFIRFLSVCRRDRGLAQGQT